MTPCFNIAHLIDRKDIIHDKPTGSSVVKFLSFYEQVCTIIWIQWLHSLQYVHSVQCVLYTVVTQSNH